MDETSERYWELLDEAVEGNRLVKDVDGCIYYVDSWDDDEVHCRTDTGESLVVSHVQMRQMFSFVRV